MHSNHARKKNVPQAENTQRKAEKQRPSDSIFGTASCLLMDRRKKLGTPAIISVKLARAQQEGKDLRKRMRKLEEELG